MSRILYCSILGLFSFMLVSCTTCSCKTDENDDDQTLFEQTLNPTAPTAQVLAVKPNLSSLTIPPKPLLGATPTVQPSSRNQADSLSDYITIMGQEGSVITVWALAARNWLWGYTAINSQNFGNIRNWKIERSFRRENFRFINQQLGTCMQAYGNGLIHDTCNPRNLDQDFDLMPTTSGAVFIKSVSQQRCVTYNPVNTQGYITITLSKCDDNITPLRDQTWYLAPPLLRANPVVKE